jgi:hypothetical protein
MSDITLAQKDLNLSYKMLDKLMNPTEKKQVARQISMMRVMKGQFVRLTIFLGESHMIKYMIHNDPSSLETAAGFLEKSRQHLNPEHGLWYSRCTYDFASVLNKMSAVHEHDIQREEITSLFQEAFNAVKSTLNPNNIDYQRLQKAAQLENQ